MWLRNLSGDAQLGGSWWWVPSPQPVPRGFHFRIWLRWHHWQINLLSTICWRIYGQATSAISTWYTWEVCQPLFSTFLHHLFPKTQLFCWLFSWSDVLSCFLLTSTQLTKNSLLSEFSRNMLLSQDFTSPVQAGSQRADKKFHVNANLISLPAAHALTLGLKVWDTELHKHSQTYKIHPAPWGACAALAGTELTHRPIKYIQIRGELVLLWLGQS